MRMRHFVLPAVALAALTVSACGGTEHTGNHGMTTSPTSSASPGNSPRNDADITFAQMMIVHHRDAITMAELATTRASDGEVKALAGRIAAAQQPEIDTMTTWLQSWGAPAPSGNSHEGMNHDSTSAMPGAMNPQDMTDLEAATGTAFDKKFIEMMIVHHEGALTMAKEHKTKGSNPEAVALAKKIETDQTTEIAEMRQLLQAS